MSQNTDYKHGYYIHLSNILSCKNKLQKEILEFLDTLDGLLLTRESHDELKDIIDLKLSILNNRHHRCKPEKYILQPIEDWCIYNFDFVKVNLYRVNHVFEQPF